MREYELSQAPKQTSARIEVPLQKESDTFVVPVLINDAITLDFMVDSGASDVSVPADVFSVLVRTGTIRDTDILGEQTYVLADGSTRQTPTFMIKSLKVGSIVVENVRGGVAPARGSLLLGQSFLEHFKSWSIDNTKKELLLEPQ
jgi:clan AA aspartic protease (TIGR02281 family)